MLTGAMAAVALVPVSELTVTTFCGTPSGYAMTPTGSPPHRYQASIVVHA